MPDKTTTLRKISNPTAPVVYIAEKRQQWIKKPFNFLAPGFFLIFRFLFKD